MAPLLRRTGALDNGCMPAGRPRSESADRAILEAARDELAHTGFDRFSLDRVATAAGVAKQTVYRRYASKNALVAECILHGYVVAPAIVPDDGATVQVDVASWIRGFAVTLAQPQVVALIRAASAAVAEDAQVAGRFQDQVNTRSRGALAARLQAGVDAGELPVGTPVESLAEIIVGSLLYRLVTHEEITDRFVDDLISVVLLQDASAVAP